MSVPQHLEESPGMTPTDSGGLPTPSRCSLWSPIDQVWVPVPFLTEEGCTFQGLRSPFCSQGKGKRHWESHETDVNYLHSLTPAEESLLSFSQPLHRSEVSGLKRTDQILTVFFFFNVLKFKGASLDWGKTACKCQLRNPKWEYCKWIEIRTMQIQRLKE